jgi:hypothetical protein
MHAPPQDHAAAAVEPDQAADVLAQINAENRDLHLHFPSHSGCPASLCGRVGGAGDPIRVSRAPGMSRLADLRLGAMIGAEIVGN